MGRVKGCAIGAEHRKNLSLALVGRKLLEAHRKKLSLSHIGLVGNNTGCSGDRRLLSLG